jgi:hypothetical protein
MKNLLISVSGGRSSATMAIHIYNNAKYDDFNKVMCYANTGLERIETIQFIEKLQNYIGQKIHLIEGIYNLNNGVGVRHKIVDYNNLNMTGAPMWEAIQKRNTGSFDGVPSTATPFCSDMTKKRVIHSFAKEYFGSTKYITAIGYRAEDMPKRISFAEIREMEKTHIYPLLTDFDKPFTICNLDEYWNKMPFKLEINSKFGNCRLCYKKSDRVIFNTILDDETVIDWYSKAEKYFGGCFFRGRRTAVDMLEQAKTPNLFIDDTDFGSCICSI